MPTENRRLIVRIVVGLLAAQLLIVAAFVAPTRKPEPRDLPVGVVGAATPVERALSARGGAFEVHRYADAAQARAAIEEREVYGAFAPSERQLLVASAAGPIVAQFLPQLAPAGLRVEDVVPLAEGDPRGTVLNLVFLPLIIICLPLAGLLARFAFPRPPTFLAALAAFSLLSGLLVIALVGEAMDALPGPFLADAGVAALIVLSIALPTAGLLRLLGPPGIGVAAVLFIVIGNPGSGNASAPELLPGFWRVVGQLLPPGAGGQALRDVAYFDGNALARPLIVLLAWALVGAALVLLAPARRPAPAPA
jgi:hypothetical protein